jgi:hypothetical protein
MSQPLLDIPEEVELDVEALVTEDDTPVDNLFSEKQQRLLTEPLYSSWPGPAGETGEPRKFLAAANVGLFPSINQPPLVPDVFLSLDVEVAEDWYEKRHRTYFFWEFGKPPEVVIEVVSNRKGNETGSKLRDYARVRITYYVVHDPAGHLGGEVLRVYEWQGGRYQSRDDQRLPDVGLGLKLWEGSYEGKHAVWLRWCDAEGNLIPTGAERAADEAERARRAAELADRETARAERATARAEQEAARAEQEAARAEQEAARAEQEAARAEQEAARAEREAERVRMLAAKLRELGVDPDRL